jgi:nucleoside-diphosphate-sugar epimerase
LNVLVTGGAGFVGSHTVDRLLDGGHDVMVVDDLSSGRRERVNVKADLAVCDIRDTARLDALLQSRRPEAIVHATAQAEVRRSLADPRHDADVNVLDTADARTLRGGEQRDRSQRPPTPGEQRRSALDPTRAEQTLGWRARTPFSEGARITLAHARAAGVRENGAWRVRSRTR